MEIKKYRFDFVQIWSKNEDPYGHLDCAPRMYRGKYAYLFEWKTRNVCDLEIGDRFRDENGVSDWVVTGISILPNFDGRPNGDMFTMTCVPYGRENWRGYEKV